jgi:hypothetical protein
MYMKLSSGCDHLQTRLNLSRRTSRSHNDTASGQASAWDAKIDASNQDSVPEGLALSATVPKLILAERYPMRRRSKPDQTDESEVVSVGVILRLGDVDCVCQRLGACTEFTRHSTRGPILNRAALLYSLFHLGSESRINRALQDTALSPILLPLPCPHLGATTFSAIATIAP